jgi:hypothetical protein
MAHHGALLPPFMVADIHFQKHRSVFATSIENLGENRFQSGTVNIQGDSR